MAGNFNPELVTVVLGVLPILGLTEDEDAIQISPDNEGATVAAGLHDEVIVDDPRRHGTATIKLMGAGPLGQATHAGLLSLYNAGSPALPLTITSIETGEVVASANAKIKRYPNVAFGIGNPTREWQFVVTKIFMQASPLS